MLERFKAGKPQQKPTNTNKNPPKNHFL